MTHIEFNKKLTCGPKFVAVRILENCEDLKIGNIYVSSNYSANGRLARAIVESVGTEAAEKYGISVGQYVMIDRLATFAHTAPVAALEYNSVICITNADGSEFWPLKDMIFVEENETGSVTNVGGIYVNDYAERLRTGTITKMNCSEELPFNVNDKVLLTKGADNVSIGNKTLRIYKKDMIIAKIED